MNTSRGINSSFPLHHKRGKKGRGGGGSVPLSTEAKQQTPADTQVGPLLTVGVGWGVLRRDVA